MTQINLPKLNQTGKNEWADVEDNDVAIREVVNGELDNTNLSGEAGITPANLAASAKPVTWYTPKVIATEQSRANTSFGKLETADEIAEVVLPTNGLIVVGYSAGWKSSTSGAGRAAIFLNENQLKGQGESGTSVQETQTIGTGFIRLSSAPHGLLSGSAAHGADVTTGQVIASVGSGLGGLAAVFAAAGTYTVSVRYKATTGSVTAKERKLWAAVLGS